MAVADRLPVLGASAVYVVEREEFDMVFAAALTPSAVMLYHPAAKSSRVFPLVLPSALYIERQASPARNDQAAVVRRILNILVRCDT